MQLKHTTPILYNYTKKHFRLLIEVVFVGDGNFSPAHVVIVDVNDRNAMLVPGTDSIVSR